MIAGERGLTQQVAGNRRRAVLLLISTAAAAGLVVGLICLLVVAPIAAVAVFVAVSAALAAGAWYGCDRLARRLIRAVPADPVEHARLVNLVAGLCMTAGVPNPALLVVDDPGANALTMGRNPRHASVVVTSGLLADLSRIELEAVLAHELSHIRSDDIVTATVAVPLYGVFAGPARAAASAGGGRLLAWLLLPLTAAAGYGLQLAVGDQREAVADLAGVALTRYPPALIGALEALKTRGTIVQGASPATAHLWLGCPLPPPAGGRLAWLNQLFETHPPLDERVEALREL